ncbi:MAG TPA: alpha/beta fold hydrolase, partial [Ignavibacteriales bacterium]|nr:alpha/beta fold hydrolase [Ignavibacteriales bacterium]
FRPLVMGSYKWSADGKSILLTDKLPARDLKTGGSIALYSLAEGKKTLQISSEKQQVNAILSPDGTHIAFSRGNNIVIADAATCAEKQLTFDGSETILNGVFDWAYEEEFSIIQAIIWSPDSKKVAFWRLDQSGVMKTELPQWDVYNTSFHSMYFPRPGGNISLVKIGIAEISSGKTSWVDLGNDYNIYIPRIAFTQDARYLTVQRLNRLQNKLAFLLADAYTGKSRTVFEESDPAWVDVKDDLMFLDDEQFVWTSEKDGYNHIYLRDLSGKTDKQLTKGTWEVDHISYVDKENGLVYYVSNERGPVYTDLYSVDIKSGEKKRLTINPGNRKIDFSSDGMYYTEKYSNANDPGNTIIYTSAAETVMELSPSPKEQLNAYSFSPLEIFTFNTSDGIELYGGMIKPAGFDPNKKYPVIIYVYGGPGSINVADSWGGAFYLWHQYMAKKGYIVFLVDNRIAGGRGKQLRNLAYRNFGDYEITDLIETSKYLGALSYVDAKRIGVWGWSYGGYVSSLAIMKAADYIKAAAAVAPVTDWRYYDAIYTERYMSLPDLNNNGYEWSSVMAHAEKYKGKLFIAHGMADDNVHYINSVMLINKLISENKQFEMHAYPDRDHNIYGDNAREHLFNALAQFFLNNL